MKPLMPEIAETIAMTLKETVKTVPKVNIITDERTAREPGAVPSIAVLSPEFSVEEASLAGSEPERKEIHEEKFNGDGKGKEFSLSEKPLRPLLTVQHPPGEEQKDPNDYTVDYPAAKVMFRTPPAKGKGNVLVKYRGVKSSADLRSMQLNLKYLVEVKGKDEMQRDELSLDVLRGLMIAKEALEREGISFKILGGRNSILNHEMASSREVPSKQIECVAQTKLFVEMPMGIMEKIVIQKRE